MKNKVVPFALAVLIVISGFPTGSLAHGYNDTWVQVKIISVGETLTVELKNGKSIRGEKQATTDESLILARMGKDIEIRRADIFRIYHHWPHVSQRRGPRGAGGAALGGLVGLLVFAGLNAGDSGRGLEEQRRHTRATALLIPAGIAAGFFLERALTRPSRELIYEAP
jgi:hypothetical protein